MILPSMLCMLIMFDIIYMIYSVITLPILLIFALTCCGSVLNDFYEDKMNKLFTYLFGMSMMDFKGFRCQRTILQLHLESIP